MGLARWSHSLCSVSFEHFNGALSKEPPRNKAVIWNSTLNSFKGQRSRVPFDPPQSPKYNLGANEGALFTDLGNPFLFFCRGFLGGFSCCEQGVMCPACERAAVDGRGVRANHLRKTLLLESCYTLSNAGDAANREEKKTTSQ